MILEFLGGAAFRALSGQVISVWTKWQDHRHEKEMMELQVKMDDRAAARQMEQLRLSAELGVRTVEVQKDADVAREEAAAFRAAMAQAFQPTGIRWVDAWNAAVRPAFASLCMWLWLSALQAQSWQVTEWDKELMAVIVGFFFADRQLRKAGK